VLNAHCTVALSKISVDSVWPLYGPMAGGTRVTITGQFLSVSTVTVVYIGQHKLYPDTNRLRLWRRWPFIILSTISV